MTEERTCPLSEKSETPSHCFGSTDPLEGVPTLPLQPESMPRPQHLFRHVAEGGCRPQANPLLSAGALLRAALLHYLSRMDSCQTSMKTHLACSHDSTCE